MPDPEDAFSSDAFDAGGEAPSHGGFVNETDPSRVLVVEDVPEMRRFLARILEGRHPVRQASRGEKALRILDDWIPDLDLVVTDLMMLGMDGETLVEATEAGPSWRMSRSWCFPHGPMTR